MNAPAGAYTGLAQSNEEAGAVRVIPEDVFAAVAAVDEMIKSSWELDASFARHSDELSGRRHFRSRTLCTMQALTPRPLAILDCQHLILLPPRS